MNAVNQTTLLHSNPSFHSVTAPPLVSVDIAKSESTFTQNTTVYPADNVVVDWNSVLTELRSMGFMQHQYFINHDVPDEDTSSGNDYRLTDAETHAESEYDPYLLQFSKRVSTTSEAQRKFNDRISKLFEIAGDEGISIDRQSLGDFRRFISSFIFIKPGSLFLLDEGQINAVWTDRGASGRISIVFLGKGITSFAIIRYWDDNHSSDIVCTGNFHQVLQQVRKYDLQELLIP